MLYTCEPRDLSLLSPATPGNTTLPHFLARCRQQAPSSAGRAAGHVVLTDGNTTVLRRIWDYLFSPDQFNVIALVGLSWLYSVYESGIAFGLPLNFGDTR